MRCPVELSCNICDGIAGHGAAKVRAVCGTSRHRPRRPQDCVGELCIGACTTWLPGLSVSQTWQLMLLPTLQTSQGL